MEASPIRCIHTGANPHCGGVFDMFSGIPEEKIHRAAIAQGWEKHRGGWICPHHLTFNSRTWTQKKVTSCRFEGVARQPAGYPLGIP